MPRPPILTSREELLKHLDATADDHNGNSGADFVFLVDRKLRPTKKDIADEFNVSPPTAADWIKVYDNDKEIKK